MIAASWPPLATDRRACGRVLGEKFRRRPRSGRAANDAGNVAKLISTMQEPVEPDLTTPTRRSESQPVPAKSEERALLQEDQSIPATTAMGGGRFVIPLSFPGTHRKLVESVALELRSQMPGLRRSNIFLDSYHSAELARPDFDTYLQNIYATDSELLVVFLGGDYEKSDWCRLEWRAVRDLIKMRRGHDVMLMRLDSAKIPARFRSTGT